MSNSTTNNKGKTRRKPEKSHSTIVDIAKKAGVSTATISRFFSNPQLLNEKTREKIRVITEREKFVPSLVAPRATIKQSTKIAYLFNVDAPFITEQASLLEGMLISSQIYAADLLSYFSSTENQTEADNRDRERAVKNRVTGVIMTEQRNQVFIDFCVANKMTIVFIVEKSQYKDMKVNDDNIIIVVDEINGDNAHVAGMLAVSLIHKRKENKEISNRYLIKNGTYKELSKEKLI